MWSHNSEKASSLKRIYLCLGARWAWLLITVWCPYILYATFLDFANFRNAKTAQITPKRVATDTISEIVWKGYNLGCLSFQRCQMSLMETF